MTRIVFFGTPREAIPALDVLLHAFQVGMVVTQPDRPKGRSGTPQAPPVKVHAEAAGVPVVQPTTRGEIARLAMEEFDLGVVVAYGRILPQEVLAGPRHGLLNIHFSLLPRWRGAAPVSRALMAGDPMTGVTIIRLDEGLDTGPVLTGQAVDIGREENAGQLTSRLAAMGASLLSKVVPPYLSGDLTPVAQSEVGATYAAKLAPADRLLDRDSASGIFLGRVRGMAPSPGAILTVDGELTKILAARVSGTPSSPGTWVVRDGVPVISVGETGVELVELQSPGRRPQSGADWVRGRRRVNGTIG